MEMSDRAIDVAADAGELLACERATRSSMCPAQTSLADFSTSRNGLMTPNPAGPPNSSAGTSYKRFGRQNRL